MIGFKRGTVKLVMHQNEWDNEAMRTIKELKELLGNIAIDIQHIGSTAIASIHAKPIIDIAIGVYNLIDIMPYIDVLGKNEFIFRGEDVSHQVLFVKGDFEKDFRTHHIHVVKWNGIEWNNYINFRDYLNAFPQKAMIYDELKQKLSIQFPKERRKYTEGKQQLIDKFLEEAGLWRAEGYSQWLVYFSKDKSVIAKAFAHMFVLEQFYVAMENNKVAGFAACTDCKTLSVRLDTKELRKHLGFMKGTVGGIMLKKEFESIFKNPQPKTGSIEFVGTAMEFRGKGVASQIINYILDNTPFQIYLIDEVADTNIPAMSLYKKLGFKEFKDKPINPNKANKIGINRIVSFKYVKNNEEMCNGRNR